MSFRGLHVLAVVPARGGSKGIPRKNLREVGGRSLVGHAATVAASLSWIDRRVLSTDDEEIAAEGRRWGLHTPFMRPAELASDSANSIDMWRHAWLSSEAHYGMRFDLSVLLEPTSPLRQATDIEATVIRLLEKEEHSGALTVSRTPAHFTPHKTLLIKDQGCISYYLKNGNNFSQRQQIPPYYHRNGICYALHRETLIERGLIIEPGRCAALIIERHVVNIDDLVDLKLAEVLMQEGTASEPVRNTP